MHNQTIEPSVLRRAEAFVDKVVAPRVAPAPREHPQTLRARAQMARDNSDAGLDVLQTAGLNFDRLNALAAERAKARDERLHQAHQRAVAGSAEAAARLGGLAPALPPADPMNMIIDEVSLIRAFADGGTVYDSSISSLDSWAKYGFEGSDDLSGGSGSARLSFFTLWQNPRNVPVILTAGSRFVVNAYLSVDANWQGVADWFGFNSSAQATVRSRTTVWGMDSSVSSVVQDSILTTAHASGGFFGGDDSASIGFDQFLNTSGVSVAAQAWSLIEVSLVTEWSTFDGSVHLDARNGAFQVSVPWLILTIT